MFTPDDWILYITRWERYSLRSVWCVNSICLFIFELSAVCFLQRRHWYPLSNLTWIHHYKLSTILKVYGFRWVSFYERVKFFVKKDVVQKKTNNGRTKWIVRRNDKFFVSLKRTKKRTFQNRSNELKKTIVFLLNKRIF